jgi:hypothetical protein
VNLVKTISLAALALSCAHGYGQGTINLFGGNFRPTNSVGNVPAGLNVGYYIGEPSAVVSPGPLPDGLSSIFTGVVHASSPYLDDGVRSVSGHLGGEIVIVQVRDWSGAYPSFEAAASANLTNCAVLIGVSSLMTLKLGGFDINGTEFPTPSLAVDGRLRSWLTQPVGLSCPEPSTTALALIGASLMRRYRRALKR